MVLELGDIHIWSVDLGSAAEQENAQLALLDSTEHARAERFHLPIHRQRFISAHAHLRQILSTYLGLAPQDIVFAYSEHNKPYLASANPHALQFNLSHSQNRAVYAFTLQHAVGIDIEKIAPSFQQSVAQRYFSPQENGDLQQLNNDAATRGFYRLWSRKEALVKAVGKGLLLPLSSFSVSLDEGLETVMLESETWSLLSLPLDQDYESALASNQKIRKIYYWRFINHSPKLDNVSEFCQL